MPLAELVRPPLPGSYLAGLPVLAGPYPGAAGERESRRRLERVLDEGCDLFLDLTEPGECEPYAHLLPPHARHVREPLRAGCVPTSARMATVVAAIERHAGADGWFLYVHDANGIDRSGMAIACWLGGRPALRRDPLSLLDELRRPIEGPWRRSPGGAAERAFVRTWTHERRGRSRQLAEGGSR
jgi:hypothetical protein